MKAQAVLRKYPSSPRKARLLADIIRGISVVKALDILRHDTRKISVPIEKLLLSSVANWQNLNKKESSGNDDLFIKEIKVDSAGILKRIKPAPQGRAHRIRKRSNHITIVVDVKSEDKKTQAVKEGDIKKSIEKESVKKENNKVIDKK